MKSTQSSSVWRIVGVWLGVIVLPQIAVWWPHGPLMTWLFVAAFITCTAAAAWLLRSYSWNKTAYGVSVFLLFCISSIWSARTILILETSSFLSPFSQLYARDTLYLGWLFFAQAMLLWFLSGTLSLFHSIPVKRLWPWIYPAGILGLATVTLYGLRTFILATRSDITIENLLRPDFIVWGYIILIGIASTNLYLISEALLATFRKAQPILTRRLLYFALASGGGMLPGIAAALDIAPIPLVLLNFAFLLFFDLYLDYRNNSLTWAIVWTLFFAGFATVLSQKYLVEKERSRLVQVATSVIQYELPSTTRPTNRVYTYFLSRLPNAEKLRGYRIVRILPSKEIQQFGITGSFDYNLQSTAFEQSATKKKLPDTLTQLTGATAIYAGRIGIQAHSPSGITVYADYPLPRYTQILPLFALLFLSLLLLNALLSWSNRRWNWLPSEASLPFYWGDQFKNRLQRLVLGVVFGSLTLFTLIAIPFFRLYTLQETQSKIIRQAYSAQYEVIQKLDRLNQPTITTLDSLFSVLALQFDIDIDLFASDGQLMASSERTIYQRGLRANQMSDALLNNLTSPPRPSILIEDETLDLIPIQMLYLPLPEENPNAPRYLGIPFYAPSTLLSEGLRSFLGAMLMVSIFLLLVSGSIAMLLSNQLTEPLSSISQGLRNFQIGRSQPLSWDTKDDEIGELVTAYNAAIKLVETSTEQLRQNERENAWREMAKQVAHEIKNPLTPMKLSIQYLLHAYQQDPGRIGQLLPKAATTLSEQIDGLAQIATEFSNFAQMPQANNQPTELNELLVSTVELFRQQIELPNWLELHIPQQPTWVYADRKQLIRVFHNLMQNAIQAMSPERAPHLTVSLDTSAGKALLYFQDNGLGIPEAIQGKVFSPNFTTKSSGMGLGLAICKNIVQQTGGRIFFKTAEQVGTTFFIEIPLLESPSLLE